MLLKHSVSLNLLWANLCSDAETCCAYSLIGNCNVNFQGDILVLIVDSSVPRMCSSCKNLIILCSCSVNLV